MPTRKHSSSGFSLIEVMLVVAVIGILTALAVPAYQQYQLRGMQAEGKSDLSRAFMSQKTVKAQYNTYANCIGLFGYSNYHKWNCADFSADDSTRQAYSVGAAYSEGDATWGNAAIRANGMTECVTGVFTCGPSVWYGVSMSYRFPSCNNTNVWNHFLTLWGSTSHTGPNAFTVVAAGMPKACNAALSSYAEYLTLIDQWTINEKRELNNIRTPAQ